MKCLITAFVMAFLLMTSFVSQTSAQDEREDVYNPAVQQCVLEWVAAQMSIRLRPDIPRPIVERAENISDAVFNAYVKFDTEGKRSNIFVEPRLILLIKGAREKHNLAHEDVHYLQFTYLGERDGTLDYLEMNAVTIQREFQRQHPCESP